MDEPISELAFNLFPQAVKDWIQELGWKREEIISFHFKNEVFCDGADKGGYLHYRQGNHVDVIIYKSQERKEQRFIRLNDVDWQKV